MANLLGEPLTASTNPHRPMDMRIHLRCTRKGNMWKALSLCRGLVHPLFHRLSMMTVDCTRFPSCHKQDEPKLGKRAHFQTYIPRKAPKPPVHFAFLKSGTLKMVVLPLSPVSAPKWVLQPETHSRPMVRLRHR